MDSVRVLLEGASSGAQGAARSGRGRKPRAQRTASRFVHIFTLMFFLSSLLSPIAAQSAFAQDEPAAAVVEEAAPAEVVTEEAAPIVAAAGALQISLYGNHGAALRASLSLPMPLVLTTRYGSMAASAPGMTSQPAKRR